MEQSEAINRGSSVVLEQRTLDRFQRSPFNKLHQITAQVFAAIWQRKNREGSVNLPRSRHCDRLTAIGRRVPGISH